jgi:hypothetical protein
VQRLHDRLFRLPSAQRLLTALCDDAGMRTSLALLLPGYAPAEPARLALLDALYARGFLVETVDARATLDGGPLAALDAALRPAWPSLKTPRSLANLLRCPDLPDVILIENVERLPAAAARPWLEFVARWAQAAHAQAALPDLPAPPALALALPAATVLEQPFESGAQLNVRVWWGVPSALELRLLCRELGEGDDHAARAAQQWREHVVPALAGPDAELFVALWDCAHAGYEELNGLLRAYGARRGWTAAALERWGARSFLAHPLGGENGSTDAPTGAARVLWAQGALWNMPEFGRELHPAALAVLDEQRALQHRVWRGQAALLLPVLDDARMALCLRLTDAYGRDWPVRWIAPSKPDEELAVREDPLACEWLHAENVLREAPEMRPEWRWLQVAIRARRLRNALAHGKPVTLAEYELLLQEIGRANAAPLP